MPKFGRSLDTTEVDLDEIFNDRSKMYRSTVTVNGVSVGWHQDKTGKLYHYDGVVWDVVPEMKINDLEYLGEGEVK